MRLKRSRAVVLTLAVSIITVASTRVRGDGVTGACGTQMITIPFTDVSSGSAFFCSIAEAYFSGLTNGTTATTYSPGDPVLREQMAAFTARTLDQSVKRSSRRAALNQYWTTQGANNLALTAVGPQPELVQSDGADLWVSDIALGTVSRVRARDGMLLGTWTGPPSDFSTVGVLCAMGKVFVTSGSTPGYLYQIDPAQPPGTLITLSNQLADGYGIGYDGQRIWVASGFGFVSIFTLNPTVATTVSTGFTSLLSGNGLDGPSTAAFDGERILVTNLQGNSVSLWKASDFTSIGTFNVGTNVRPVGACSDGLNFWITFSNTGKLARF